MSAKFKSLLNNVSACLGLCLLVVAGCTAAAAGRAEDVVPVSGSAIFNGEPYERLMVSFVPTGTNSQAHQGTGITDADGQFVMMNYQNKEGLPAGSYTVTFSLWLTPAGEVPPAGEPPATSRAMQAIPSLWRDVPKAGTHNTVVVPEDGKTDFEFKIPKS
jgi:hypothetical protein